MTKQTTKRNAADTTIADIHKTRERISDEFGGDISAITEAAIRRQEQSNRRTVSYAEVTNIKGVNPSGENHDDDKHGPEELCRPEVP
jgi:hypothetical protein